MHKLTLKQLLKNKMTSENKIIKIIQKKPDKGKLREKRDGTKRKQVARQ